MEEKDFILENAHVLFISCLFLDYYKLQNYGFKNICFYSSIQDVLNDLKNHKIELEDFDIFFEGRLFKRNTIQISNFYHLLWEKDKNSFVRAGYVENKFKDFTNCLGFVDVVKMENVDFVLVCDEIVRHVVSKKDCMQKIIKRHQFSEWQKGLSLPKKISELKILYLESFLGMDAVSVQKIAQDLGISVTVREYTNDESCDFDFYDIILAPAVSDSKIKEIRKNVTENKRLQLLLTYHSSLYSPKLKEDISLKNLGSFLSLYYSFLGTENLDSTIHEQTYRVIHSENSSLFSVFSHAIFLYNEALKNIGFAPLSDFNLENAFIFEKKYLTYEKEMFDRILVPLRMYDELFSMVSYLFYKKKTCKREMDGMRIIKHGNCYFVENYLFRREARSLGTLELSIPSHEMLKKFKVQCALKDGSLSFQQLVGIYPLGYLGEVDVLYPDSKQWDVFVSIYKKALFNLRLLIQEEEKEAKKQVELVRKK